MPYIVIENFNGGMDTRRMASAGTPGTLLELTNAHITRGGEIEKRKAYELFASLNAGSTGLAWDDNGLVVFGHKSSFATPSGVRYQSLPHPDGHPLAKIRSWDLYAGKIYVAAEYDNGDILHFYDGTRVADWFDGKARGVFTIATTGTETGRQSSLSFNIAKDSEELRIRFLMTNEDDPEEPINLTGGWVTAASGTAEGTWAGDIRDAINNETPNTGVEASLFLLTGLSIQSADRTVNLDGLKVWAEVEETGAFRIDPQASPVSPLCTGDGACSNRVLLKSGVEGGATPYTYEWEVLDSGTAGSASLSSTTDAEPYLTVSGATGGGQTAHAVLVRCKVTDDTAQVLEEKFLVASRHSDIRSLGGSGGDRLDPPGGLYQEH